MGEMLIKIPEDSPNAILTIVGENGVTKQKSIAIEDLVANLVSDYKLSTGLVPSGTRYFKGSAANYTIIIEIPAKIRDMTLSTYNATGSKRVTEIIQIPYPTCLLFASVKSAKINDIRLYSLKHPIQSETDGIYCFPYSNVYTDGRICWGSVALPKISKPMELIGVINLFLGSQFNGDLAGSNFTSPKGIDIHDFWSLVSHVKKLQEFPVEVLRTSSLTFKKLCSD